MILWDLLLPLSHAALSIGLLCARKGRRLESCRAHLTLFYSRSFFSSLRNYWIYYYHLALLLSQLGYYAPEKAAGWRAAVLT
jgi:hypothetical protein